MKKICLAFLLTLSIFVRNSYALDVEQVQKEITEELSKNLKCMPKDKPILLLVGGYPGAGKTTLINALIKPYDLSVIAWNSIRQSLLDRGIERGPYDWEIITAVNRNLLRTCLEHRANIVIDANAYRNNIKLFENLLEEEGYKDLYRVVKICLNPPEEVLLSRIRARRQSEGMHQGTEADLMRDLHSEHKRLHMDDYSLILKNDETMPFEKELELVNLFLEGGKH